MTQRYIVSKTYTPETGLSCTFRQWRAKHSHCRFLHGYAIGVTIEFAGTDLDSRRWLVDFGAMSKIRDELKLMFDHKTVVAEDDPQLPLLRQLHEAGVVDLQILPDVGCESFARYVFAMANVWLGDYLSDLKSKVAKMPERVVVHAVTVFEHAGNSARIERFAT